MPEPKAIRLRRDSELCRILNDVGDEPVVLDANGEHFRVNRIETTPASGGAPWPGYVPEDVLAAIDRFEGIWSDRDPDTMIARIRQSRAEGSRPEHRP